MRNLAVLSLSLSSFVLFAFSASAATFIVNSNGDGPDDIPGDGIAQTASGQTTLRAALDEANTLTGPDRIEFSGAIEIEVTNDHLLLNDTSGRTTIDAGGQSVTLRGGAGLPTDVSGLLITSAGNEVLGLTIVGFPSHGILINGSGAFGNIVRNCFIGTEGSSTGEGNGGVGIQISSGASNSTIGGALDTDRNVIAGNGSAGVLIGSTGSRFNTISGNYIGVAADGVTPIGNTNAGVGILEGADTNTIGSLNEAEGNIIAGNSGTGVFITGASTRSNSVIRNRIGVAADGSVVGNGAFGVAISDGATDNSIGGDFQVDLGNLIAGHSASGVLITDAATNRNSVRFNSMFENGTGIVIEDGANGGNFPPPVITGVNPVRGTTEVLTFVDIYAGPQGEHFLGTVDELETTDGAFSIALNLSEISSDVLVASAFSGGNSTIFSAPFTIPDDPCEEETPDRDGDGVKDCIEEQQGTNPDLPDTDGDGMPDGFETDEGLDPLTDDSLEDNDNDGLSNVEEFWRGSSPSDPNDPASTFYVSTTGTDTPGGGTSQAPWATLGFALSQVNPSPAAPVQIVVSEGSYAGGITLKNAAGIVAAADEEVVIQGTLVGAPNSSLVDVIVQGTSAGQTLLTVDNAMRVSGVTFMGDAGRTSTGIDVSGTAPVEAVVESCLFTSLGIGMDIADAVPRVRRSIFENLTQTGIILRATTTTGEGALGDATDPRVGFNTFRNTIEGSAVLNERTETVAMEQNDWGTNDPVAIDAFIEGPADFEPFLAAGSAVLGASLFCTVWDADTQERITNATLQLVVSSFSPISENEDGVYAYPALQAGSYNIIVNAPGYPQKTQAVTVDAAKLASVIVPLGVSVDDPKSPPMCAAGPGSAAKPQGDMLVTLGMMALLLAACRRGRRA